MMLVMRFVKCAAAFICTLVVYADVQAQWYVSASKLHRSVVLDLMNCQSKKMIDTFSFFGPTFDLNETVKKIGCDLFKNDTPNNSASPFENQDTIYRMILPAKTKISRENGFVYINCYTNNISEYVISFDDGCRNAYSRSFNVSQDRYQIPSESPVSLWRRTGPDDGDKKKLDDSISICNLYIKVKRNELGRSHSFVVGELKLFEHLMKEEPAKGCFFYQVTGDPVNLSPSFSITNIGNSYPLSKFTIFRDAYSQSFSFRQIRQMPDKELKDSTLSLMLFIMDKYPYYEEHHLNKDEIISRFLTIRNSEVPFEAKMHSIDSLIGKLYDGHFYIEKAPVSYVSGPIHVRKINGDFRVIAVFDPELRNKVNPGCKLVCVDGIPVNKVVEATATRYFGDSLERSNMAVAKMLFKPSNDSTTIEISDDGVQRSVTYYYKRDPIVPDNFKPVNRKVVVKNKVFYYRLNNWNIGDWLVFYNYRAELENSSAVIFDLRGNSGGMEVEAFKMFSGFIKTPVTISVSSYRFNNSRVEKAENIVTPNRYLNLSGKKVVILVDNNTACASEIFINAMKNYANAIVIGSDKTAGSYASGEVFYLPLNIKIHVNILNKFSFSDRMSGSIEMKGINPDIKVALNDYKDLYPYEDKILKTAYGYLARINGVPH